ncbi:MAG: DegT/DnrJ/EryC1/StrS aminotransferase family protein [Candidatus Omnitrophota bacterium]
MLIAHSRPALDNADIAAVADVIKSKQISQGALVRKFEKHLAGFISVKDTVAVSSGTAALHLALLSLGIREGDEVILPSFTCAAVLNAVLYTGAKPVFADIELDDYNISLKDAKRRISKKTKALLLVHMFGEPADISGFGKLGIPVVEDIAQAVGAEHKGKKLGSFGKVSVCSFYATKVMTSGEGGAVFSSDNRILEDARSLREYDKMNSFKLRFNYKLTDMQAALGLAQLKKLPGFIKTRRRIAAIYDAAFGNSPKKGIYYRYVIRTHKNADFIIAAMRKKGVLCARPVFKPLHRYFNTGGCPKTELAWQRAVSVPIYPALSNKEVTKIKNTLRDIIKLYG